MKRLVTMLALAALAVAGCGSGGTDSAGSTGPHTYNVSDADNGHTLDVHLGDTIVLTLHSTYWTILPTDGLILQPVGAPQPSTAPSCNHSVPGSGCGTITATFDVGQVGTSTLKAHRDSCGEALRCTGSAGDWSLKVVAS